MLTFGKSKAVQDKIGRKYNSNPSVPDSLFTFEQDCLILLKIKLLSNTKDFKENCT